MSEEKRRVHAARMVAEKGGRVWVLFDEAHTLRGKPNESRNALLRRWQDEYGEVHVLVRIKGVCRPSELAMHMADLKRQADGQMRE